MSIGTMHKLCSRINPHLMKTKIIHLVPFEKKEVEKEIKKNEINHLVHAAWSFAYAALWNHDLIQSKEIEDCKEFIQHYFQLHGNRKEALPCFCERILLAKEYFEHYPHYKMPPTIWLHHNNDEGFTSTLTWYQQLLVRRQLVPDFRKDLQIITNCFLQYAFKPSATSVKECRKKLLALRANDLLQIFYNSIIHIHY